MEFGIENCDTPIIKNGKRQITKGNELPNQERIRMFGEKENFKYLGILEEDTIKNSQMKEKEEKSTPDKRENLWKPGSAAKISSKE